MNLKSKFSFVWLFLAALLVFPACALTPGQQTAALVEAGGQAYGARYLTSHVVNGVVDPVILAQYEKNLQGIRDVMQGGMDAYTFQNIVQQVVNSTAVTPGQAGAIGFLGPLSSTFIKDNGGAVPTPDGARMDALAKQLAEGLRVAINQVTGANYVIPPPIAPSS